MKVIDLNADYEVQDKDIKLTIIIGNAQIGSSIVRVGTKEIARGDVKNASVGNGSSVTGKALQVKSVVTDVNDRTNRTSIVYRLAGGKRNQDFMSSGTVQENGDSIIYRAKFKLV